MVRILSALLFIFLATGAFADTGSIRVAVSIKPLHSIVSTLTQGVAEPQLIVRTSGSPHGYNLRPSEQRMLQQADLVIWAGPELETFLEKSLGNGKRGAILELLRDVRNLKTYPAREGGQWEEHHEGHADEHDHAHGSIDPHIWLSPGNARLIAEEVLRHLVRIDPKNERSYRRNLDLFLNRLRNLDDRIADKVKPHRTKKYIVFHDAYQYFEKHYALNPAGALAIDPDRRPGARRLKDLKNAIREHGVECVFSEPQFEPQLVRILTEGTSVRTGTLDPLGADLAPGPNLYFDLLGNMAASIESCLTGQEQ